MRKQNTWRTLIIGGIAAVSVAAAFIVWSGNRTQEKPDTGLESSDQQLEIPGTKAPVLEKEPGTVPTKPTQGEKETKEEITDRWEVDATPEETESPEKEEEPEKVPPVIQNPPVSEPKDETPNVPVAGTQIHSLNFAEGQPLGWPVKGNIIQYYSMDTTVYFPTLDQYKCSPAIQIQSEAGTPVMAPADAKIVKLGEDAKIGRYVELELGNGYGMILGQLTDLQVNEGDYVARGTQIAVVAAPTRYYVVEGDNIYVQMYCKENTVDPLDYLE